MKKEVKVVAIKAGSPSNIKTDKIEQEMSRYTSAGWTPIMQYPVYKSFLFIFKRFMFLTTFIREV